MIVGGLKHLDLKPNDNINKEKYGLINSASLRKYFLDYLFYFLLLPYSVNKPAATDSTATNVVTPEIPACMSEILYKRYKNDFNLDDGDEIEKVIIF